MSIPWDEDRRLGSIPDSRLAELRGVAVNTVRYHRLDRGIPEYRPAEDDVQDRLRESKLLGKWCDDLVAERYQCSPWLVVEAREELGVPPRVQYEDEDLRSMSDEDLAKKYGTTLFDAFLARSSAGYSRTSRKTYSHDWNSEDRLGKIRDGTLAKKIGCSRATVVRQRQKRGIPPSRSRENPLEGVRDLGEVPDSEIAERVGVSRSLVTKARLEKGIPSFRDTRGEEIDWDEVSDLGQVPDQEIADRLGVTRPTVVRQRAKRAIPPAPRKTTYDWESVLHMVGNVPDHVVAERLDAPLSTVVSYRRRYGISAFKE